MDKNRGIRSRCATTMKGFTQEKDRQRRPGTPMRNQRPLNSIRTTESALPVQLNYSDFSDDDKVFKDLNSKREKSVEPTLCLAFPRDNGKSDSSKGTKSKIRPMPTANLGIEDLNTDPCRSEILYRRASSTGKKLGSSDLSLDAVQFKGDKPKKLPLITPDSYSKALRSKATITNTTNSGLPPLEGVHAGVGFGLNRKRTSDQVLTSLDSIEDLYERMVLEDRIKGSNDRLTVPSSVLFERSIGKRRAYAGIISIQNKSEYFMTYCVKASEPKLFEISPSVGMILPLESQSVVIKTNSKYDFIFKDISTEVFKVFATPVYSRCQMKVEKLHLLWRAFGTPMFPRIAAEEHTISYIYQKSSTKDSLLATISRNHRWLSSFWCNSKPVSINDSPISEEEFYQAWPLEDDHYNFMTCRNQLDGWFWHLRKAREETNQMRCEMRQCVAILLLLLFVAIVFLTNIYPVPPSFRMAHDLVHATANWMKLGLNADDNKPVRMSHWDRLIYNLIHWPAFRMAQ